MKIAIMQPYFFPYIGYWQLISGVDTFVIYDDVTYIKQGYINRNTILCQNKLQRITLEVVGASSNKYIGQVKVGMNNKKLLKTISQCYKKAPMYFDVYPLLENMISNPEKNLSLFLGNIIEQISNYLGITTKIIYSSKINKKKNLKGEYKIIAICQQLEASNYINAIGGRQLYNRNTFESKGIRLEFLQSQLEEYPQQSQIFIPNLSIIDVMMNNPPESIKKLLKNYQLV